MINGELDVMERLTTRNSEGVAVLKTPYQCERCGEVIYRLADYGSGEPIEKLAGLEDLEEQGKLLKLLCAVGDTVYEVQDIRKRIQPYEITSASVDRWGKWYFYWRIKDGQGIYGRVDGFPESYLGMKVFLTRDEAEEALKRMEDGK